jgi:phosphate transport system permease protein
MNNSENTKSSLDGFESNAQRTKHIASTLKTRRRKETRFRFLGILAVTLSIGLVGILFGTILAKGIPAFWQATFELNVDFSKDIIKVEPKPVQQAGESQAAYQDKVNEWANQLNFINWNKLLINAVAKILPQTTENPRAVLELFASSSRFALRDMVINDPSVIGKTVKLDLVASANTDVWIKGNIDRSLPDNQQQLSPDTRKWADELYKMGVIQNLFSKDLFTNSDSRSSPATAGLLGAFVGSLMMMIVVILFAVPVGVAAAVYLEEFAPQNRFTDFIEVNINNLAAVPSIVFGLLGASVFIIILQMPLSAPIVGGLVLSLMTLPTVIIATRASLKAIPPSIREGALALGASRVQAITDHVLPLARPGILTATIIGVAQALGETAPLLLIGMSAFVANVPATPLDPSTALPVQIFLWNGNELRNFFEARTSAAIIILLALMLTLNSLAIWLRKKFEIRW